MQENFTFGKWDYLRIYFSLTARAALGLLGSCCGHGEEAAGEESCAHGRAPPALGRTEAGAGSEQQLARLLVGPQEDEPSQADGCHPRDNTCKQAEGKGKAASG